MPTHLQQFVYGIDRDCYDFHVYPAQAAPGRLVLTHAISGRRLMLVPPILPNPDCWSDIACAAINDWVREHGKTGRGRCCVHWLNPCHCPALKAGYVRTLPDYGRGCFLPAPLPGKDVAQVYVIHGQRQCFQHVHVESVPPAVICIAGFRHAARAH